MTKNLKKLTLSITASALLAGNAFALDSAITNFGYTNSQAGDFTIFDFANPSKSKNINLGLGVGYDSLVINPTVTSVYATNRVDGTVGVFNPINGTFTNTSIDVDNRPLGIVMSSDGSTAYVANAQSGTISVINTTSNTVTNTIDINAWTGQGSTHTAPARMTLSPDGTKLYVTDDQDTFANSIFVIDTTTNSVIKEIATGTQAIGITLNQDGTKAYIANENANQITVINLQDDTTSTINVGTYPVGVVLSKDGTKLYVTNAGGDSISIINTSTNSVTDTITNVAGVAGISISPDGSKLYATNYNSNALYMIDTTTNQVTTYNNISTETSENISPSFISANLLTGTLEIASAAQMLEKGFDNYVNFAGGTLKATGSFTLSNPVYLHDEFNLTWDDSSTFTTVAGGTVDTNGYDVTFSGEVSGVGSLTKTGNGVLTLSANNTYTGNTNVNGGTLAVTGDTSSSDFVVNNSGILSGNGTVGNTTVKNGGVIYPTETSTLNVDGNLTFENGSIYRLNANKLAQSGKIAVSGTASIDGNVEVKADNSGTWNETTNYEILTANSISGTFDGVSSDLAFLTPTLQYNQTGKVNLTLARNDVTNEDVINTTDYDKELLPVTKALDNAEQQNIPSMQDLFTVINGMNTAQAKDAYRQLLGTSLNNTHTISNSLSTFNTNLFDRLSRINSAEITGTNSGDEILIGSDNGKYNLWSRVLGGASKLNGDTLRSKVSSNSSGIQMGAEKISDDIVFGTSLAYIASDVNFKNDEAKSDMDTYILGLYAQKTFTNNVFVNADVNVGQNKNQTSRTTPTNKAFSDPKSNTISTNLEVGYKFDLSNNLYLKPSIIGGYTHLTQDAYKETGAGGANLSIDKYNTNSSNLGVSLKTQKVFTQNNKDFADVEFGIGYVEEFGDTNKALNATFASAPNSGNFEIRGVDKDSHKYIASISTNYYLSSTSSLFASVNGAKNSDEESINGVLGVKIGF